MKFPMRLEVSEMITQHGHVNQLRNEGVEIVGAEGIGYGDLYINGRHIGKSMAVRQDMPELYFDASLEPHVIGPTRSTIEGFLEA